MPNHKNHLKLTGDTHPPELGDIALADELDEAQPVTAIARVAEEPAQPREASAAGKSRWLDRVPFRGQASGYASQARNRVSEQPLAALGIAVALGFVIGKLIRR